MPRDEDRVTVARRTGPRTCSQTFSPRAQTPEFPLLLVSLHQTRQSGSFSAALPASASPARPGDASLIRGGETGSGSGPVRVGKHKEPRTVQRLVAWRPSHGDSLHGGSAWGPMMGAHSLCHGSVPVLPIKVTLTGDYTALCKARPPAAALQVGTGAPGL